MPVQAAVPGAPTGPVRVQEQGVYRSDSHVSFRNEMVAQS